MDEYSPKFASFVEANRPPVFSIEIEKTGLKPLPSPYRGKRLVTPLGDVCLRGETIDVGYYVADVRKNSGCVAFVPRIRNIIVSSSSAGSAAEEWLLATLGVSAVVAETPEKTVVTLPVPGWITVVGVDPWSTPISAICFASEARQMAREFQELLREFLE